MYIYLCIFSYIYIYTNPWFKLYIKGHFQIIYRILLVFDETARFLPQDCRGNCRYLL